MNKKVSKSCVIHYNGYGETTKHYELKWSGRIKSDLEAEYDQNGNVLKCFEQSGPVFEKYIQNQLNDLFSDHPHLMTMEYYTVEVFDQNTKKRVYYKLFK